MGTIFVDNLEPQSGTSLTLGASGDTLQAASGVTNNLGISMADHWRLTADFTGSGVGQLTSNLARVNVDGFTQIGTGMTESSGVFTFPITGMYLIFCHGDFLTTGNASGYSGLYIRISTDGGSSYATRSQSWTSIYTSGVYGAVQNNQLFNVTNTSTHKVMFRYELNNSQKIEGSANSIRSHFIFIRLGDST